MGLTERQALALALAESRRAVQPPPQDSDSDEDASDSGACTAKPAPAPRRPLLPLAGGGSDDESAAGPKPGDKVRRRVGDGGRSAGAAKRRRVGTEAGARELQGAGCGVQARKALAAAAAVPVAAAELGKASTSSDNSKASRTTSAMLPAAARTADSLLPTPDVKPCAPASEASKADSGGSDGGGRGAGGSGSGPGSGLGSDSDGEGRSARSSRDVVRPAGARGSRGEGEGDSSERGGRRVSDSAEGGAGAAGCAGEDALGPDATSVRAQRLAVRQAQQFQAARSPRAAAGGGPGPSPGQRAKEAGAQGAAGRGLPHEASAAEAARAKPSPGQRASSEGRLGNAGRGGGAGVRAGSPKPAPYVAELVEADLFSLPPAKALPAAAAKDKAPGDKGRGAGDGALKIRVCAGAGLAAELAEAAVPEPDAAPCAEGSPAARSPALASRKQPRKRPASAAGAGRDRAPRCARARPRRAERPDDDPDYEGEDDGAAALLCREPGVLEEGGPATSAVKPEWANPFEVAAGGAGWADGAKAASPDPGTRQPRVRPPTRAARSASRPRPSGRWAPGPLGGSGGGPVTAKFGAPASERRLRSAAVEDAALELEAGIFWRPPPARKSARASPVLSACALLRACDEEQAPPLAGGTAIAQSAAVVPALAHSLTAAALPGCVAGFTAGFADTPAPPSPFLQASQLGPGDASREGSTGSKEGTAQCDLLQTPPPSPPPPGTAAERAASLTFCTPADGHKNAHTPTLTPMRAPALPAAASLDLAGAAAALLQGGRLPVGTPAETPLATPAATPVAAGTQLGVMGQALFAGRLGSATPSLSLAPVSPVAAAALATCAALRERHDSEGLRLQRSAALDAADEGAEETPRQSLHNAPSLPGSRLGKALAGGAAAAGGGGVAHQGSPALESGLGSGFRRACSVLRAPLERVASPVWSGGGFGAAPRGRGPSGGLRSDASAQHLQQARSQRLLESTWDDLLARQAAEAQAAEALAVWLAPALPRSQPASPVAQGS